MKKPELPFPGLRWTVCEDDGLNLAGYFAPPLRNYDGATFMYVVLRMPDRKWVAASINPDINTAEPFDSPEAVVLWLQLQGYSLPPS